MRRLVPFLVLGWIAATYAVGIGLERIGDTELGTPLPPALFDVHGDVSAWVVLALAVAVGAVAAAPRLRPLRPWAFAAAATGLALALRLAIGAARSGPEGWNDAFAESFEAKNEYLAGLPALEHGVPFFLDQFAELVPALAPHVAGHPPGFVVALHLLGIDSANGVTALLIAAGVLAVPLTYGLARRLLDEERARAATLLSAFASGATLYGVTAADVAFMTMGTGAAALLLASRRVAATAGAAATAAGMLFSYALPATAVWALLARAAGGRDGERRGRLRDAALVGAACAAAVGALWLGMYAAFGFEILDAIATTSHTYHVGVASERPYLFWLFGSPAAFLAFMGLPIVWYLARAAAEREVAALALVAILVVSAVGGFTKAETERIWLMYLPLACVAAAAVLPGRRLPLVLGLLAAQSLLVELIFGTVW